MANSFFQFKQFTIQQDKTAMKVTTDACLFGAWVARKIKMEELAINNCLDIGTGTGLLSLMLAQNIRADIDAVELDPDAAEQAIENVNASPWADRVTVIDGDIKDVASFSPHKYKIILSNPPFYENELAAEDVQKNLAHHAGGLLISELAEIIDRTLHPNGRFYLLLPFKRIEEVELILSKNSLLITRTCHVRQSRRHGFFRVMISGKHGHHDPVERSNEELTITDDNGQYSKEFVELLKDYYLHL